MICYIKKHWFLVSFLFLLTIFIILSIMKISNAINLSNLDNESKTNIILCDYFPEIEENKIKKETEIMFKKYQDLGYNLKNVNYNVILNTVFPIFSKYESYRNIQKYITNNNIDLYSKEEFIKNFHTKELTLEEEIIADYFYYLYQTTSSINHYKENNSLAENTDIEKFIEENYSEINSELKQYYKTYLRDNIYEQNFFESLQE